MNKSPKDIDIVVGDYKKDPVYLLASSIPMNSLRSPSSHVNDWDMASKIDLYDFPLYASSMVFVSKEFEELLKGDRVQHDLLMDIWGAVFEAIRNEVQEDYETLSD